MTKLSENHFKSMHVYYSQLSEKLNDAGYDFKKFLEVAQYKLDVPWTKDLVKNQLWRAVQISQTSKKSTTEITPYEAIQIYEIVNNRVAELTGVSVEWPCEENRREQSNK